jgi:hypothetical protein
MAPPRQVPLFDLISKRPGPTPPGAAPRTPPSADAKLIEAKPGEGKPVVRVEAASQSAPATRASVGPARVESPMSPTVSPSRDPDPPASAEGPGGAATLPRSQVIWIITAAAIMLVLISYILGVTLGRKQAETKAEQEIRQLQPLPVEPGTDASPTLSGATQTRPGTTPENRQGGAVRPPAPGTLKPAPMSATRPAIRAAGQPQTDPREADRNYLALVNLNEEDTRAAIAYLAGHGLDAFAIPLETGAGAANNRGPAFRLYALPGITAEEFRQRKTVRTNLETAVTRLGEKWQKEERGPANFSKHGWEKYTAR